MCSCLRPPLNFSAIVEKNMEFNSKESVDKKNAKQGRRNSEESRTNQTKYFKTFFSNILQFYFTLFMLGLPSQKFIFRLFSMLRTASCCIVACVLGAVALIHERCIWICMLCCPFEMHERKIFFGVLALVGILFATHSHSVSQCVLLRNCISFMREFLMHAENAHKTNKLQQTNIYAQLKLCLFVCLFVEILCLGSSCNT